MLQLFCWDKMDPHLKFDSKVKTDDTTITHSPRRCEKLYLTIKRLAEERSSGFQTWKKKKCLLKPGEDWLEFYGDRAWLAWWTFSSVLWSHLFELTFQVTNEVAFDIYIRATLT